MKLGHLIKTVAFMRVRTRDEMYPLVATRFDRPKEAASSTRRVYFSSKSDIIFSNSCAGISSKRFCITASS